MKILQLWRHAIVENHALLINAPSGISYSISILSIQSMKVFYVNSLEFYFKALFMAFHLSGYIPSHLNSKIFVLEAFSYLLQFIYKKARNEFLNILWIKVFPKFLGKLYNIILVICDPFIEKYLLMLYKIVKKTLQNFPWNYLYFCYKIAYVQHNQYFTFGRIGNASSWISYNTSCWSFKCLVWAFHGLNILIAWWFCCHQNNRFLDLENSLRTKLWIFWTCYFIPFSPPCKTMQTFLFRSKLLIFVILIGSSDLCIFPRSNTGHLITYPWWFCDLHVVSFLKFCQLLKLSKLFKFDSKPFNLSPKPPLLC